MRTRHARIVLLATSLAGAAFLILNQSSSRAWAIPEGNEHSKAINASNLTTSIPPSGFIYPVLAKSVSDPLLNVKDPRDDGWHVNNGFGNYCPQCLLSKTYVYHPGQDLNIDTCATCDKNLPVYAVQDGLVIRSHKMSDNLGWAVIIRHDLDSAIDVSGYYLPSTTPARQSTSTVSSAYLHLNKTGFGKDGELDIRQGDAPVTIKKGDQVGTIYPNTGGGPHLHFEMRVNGSASTAGTANGYYQELQDITDFGNIDALAFIRDHVGVSSCDNGSSEPLRVNGNPPTHPDGTIVKTSTEPTRF
jgi:murein DD-endopeptidase MepM/ murein hydrolase activator NlpD